MVREGVYTVQNSVCCEPDNTREPWMARAEETSNEFLGTAVEAFGEQAKQGDLYYGKCQLLSLQVS
jgi:hypothetical protein